MLNKYFQNIFNTSKTGDATEESFYPDLKRLLEDWGEKQKKKFYITPLPKRTEVGNPDFRVWDGKQYIVGYIEAKKPTIENLETIENSEQLKRYRDTFPNLILTNFFEFRLLRNGQLINRVIVGRPFIIHRLKTVPPIENEEKFLKLLEQFFSFSIPKTYTAKQLAIELAKKTRFLRDQVIEEELKEEKIKGIQNLEGFYKAFKDHLISSLTLKDFSNLFAQTITYSLFTARSRAKDGFNRKLAYELIPHTIGILRDVFRFISSTDLPQSMEWIIDDIAEVLSVADVKNIMGDFYQKGKGKDPVIHFYETFLAEYDPKEREKRGVYYTPEPVVSYIVRSIHYLLKEKFEKNDGFANSSVTVLDPAAGTLTFPAMAIKTAIEEYQKKYGEGGTKSLIKDHILRNFYAFELMMAPYAIGHLKIGFLLDEFGYKLSPKERFKLYLTNTLEAKDLTQSEIPGLMSLSEESKLAGKVKRKIPILVIFGNPPYSVSSENKSEFIEKIMDLYKEDVRDERNIQPLSDDYIKFIRFAHWKINQAGKGIIGLITNNSYLSGLIHRGMRKKLAEEFDEIYILNLHGSSLIGETAPDGGKDENVFDIRQGVAIALFVKTSKKKEKLARIFYKDLYGLRGDIDKKATKYHYLWNNDVNSSKWIKLNSKKPSFFLVPKDFSNENFYKVFVSINKIFSNHSGGIKTRRDNLMVAKRKNELIRRFNVFVDSSISDNLISQMLSVKNTPYWRVSEARKIVEESGNIENFIHIYDYRPFDKRYVYYNPRIIERGDARFPLMKNFLKANLGLITMRQVVLNAPLSHFFVTDALSDMRFMLSHRGAANVFPLYLYNDAEIVNEKKTNPGPAMMMLFDKAREGYRVKKTNIDPKLLDVLEKAFIKKPTPEEIFYYIYAILYSNIYREKYQEFLKIDFPKIPFTKDHKLFRKLAESGKELVSLHLLKHSALNKPIVKFYGKDSNLVEKREYVELFKPEAYWPRARELPKEFKKSGIVKINDKQFFVGIKPEIWNYYIGGYQVLDKWLKDRKGRTLSSEDIKHYCKVATVLSRTIETQKQIDKLYSGVEKDLI